VAEPVVDRMCTSNPTPVCSLMQSVTLDRRVLRWCSNVGDPGSTFRTIPARWPRRAVGAETACGVHGPDLLILPSTKQRRTGRSRYAATESYDLGPGRLRIRRLGVRIPSGAQDQQRLACGNASQALTCQCPLWICGAPVVLVRRGHFRAPAVRRGRRLCCVVRILSRYGEVRRGPTCNSSRLISSLPACGSVDL
jgi:hypothetical protein